MSFKTDIEKFAKSVEQDVGTALKEGTFFLLLSVIDLTPRDTGRAKSSWNVSKLKVNLSVKPEGEYPDPSEMEILGAVNNIGDIKNGDVLYLSNNLEYIEALERGHSKIQGGHMLAISVANWEKFIKDAARNVA